MDSEENLVGPASGKSRGPFGWLRMIPWLLIVVAIGTACWLQLNATNLDPAIINVVTANCGLLIWFSLCLGLWWLPIPALSGRRARQLGIAVAAAPVIAAIGFLFFCRLERIDGELKPIFRPRWQTEPALPQVAGQTANRETTRLSPRPTDFPQFLGPTRNAVVAGVELERAWTTPPKIEWVVPIGDGWSGFAIQGDVAVTMEQRDTEEWVSCYDIENGDLLWKYSIPSKHTNVLGGIGPRSTPTIFENRVYAVSAVSRIVCLELATGQPLWEQELLELAATDQAAFEAGVAWGRSSSPLIYDGQVISSLGGVGEAASTLIAFDAATGEELWRAGSHQISYASPTLLTLLGKPQIAIIDEKSLTAFDAASTHAQLWSVPWPGASNGSASVSQPQQVDEQQVFMSKGYGTGCQLVEVSELDGTWSATVVWKSAASLRTKFTTAVIHQGYAYGLSDGILECVDLSDGKRKWKKGRYQQGQVLLVGDLLLITSEDGEIVLVSASPEGFEELAKMDVIGDVTWNTAALSGDRLLMRNSDEAACVRLPVRWIFEGNQRQDTAAAAGL